MGGPSSLGPGSREPHLLLALAVGLGTQRVAGPTGSLRARRVKYEGAVSDEEAGEAGREERPAGVRSRRALPG